MDSKISVVINTLNEEANIAECIRSVQGLADEVVVCDMHSTDGTIEVAQSLGARVALVEAEYCDFGRLRHFAVTQAQYEWVLVIDADECMTSDLATKLKEVADENKFDVVYLANLYWYFGGWVQHGGFFSNNWPRFFRRGVYLSLYEDYDEAIHEDLSALKSVANHMVLPKSYYLQHYAYPTLEKYVSKTVGMYARIEAEQYFKRKRQFSLLHLLSDPIKTFIGRYIIRQGFRDGLRGFILAVLYAGYHFTTWANLWLLEEREQQKRSSKSPLSEERS